MPHANTTTTLLATLGLFTFAPLALAAEGDVSATQDAEQAAPESLETEDAWIELDLPEEPQAEQEVEIVIEPAVESIEIGDPTQADDTPADEEAAADGQAEPEVEANVISMDRSDWPKMIVSPVDGKVTHHPHFTGEAPLGDDIVTPLHAPDPVWQIQEALAGAHANNLNGENLSHLGSQPFVGLAQFVLMPARMVLENPWAERTSPDSE